MTVSLRKPLRLLPLAALTLSLGLVATARAADPIEQREQDFKAAKRSVEQIKAGLGDNKPAAVAAAAQSLSDLGARIPGLFPPGSNQGKTDAKAEIWTNFADFTAKAKTFQERADTLAQLAAAPGADRARLADAFDRMMASCKACHRAYKED